MRGMYVIKLSGIFPDYSEPCKRLHFVFSRHPFVSHGHRRYSFLDVVDYIKPIVFASHLALIAALGKRCKNSPFYGHHVFGKLERITIKNSLFILYQLITPEFSVKLDPHTIRKIDSILMKIAGSNWRNRSATLLSA
ncbi:hypothetical protein EGJ11_08035 [Stutzerimonas stutzeri]|nr:hypothetical protein EGJ11_08035 [Stutzerimonas stutzeri]